MQLHEFYRAALDRSTKKGERYGQAMFNHLAEVRPDLAKEIIGTDKDPYYVGFPDPVPNWQRFILFLKENW